MDLKLICKQLSGSHAYGLNIEDSDLDYKGVFVATNVAEIIGTKRFDHQVTKLEGNDHTYYELRQFLRHLEKANTGSLEILFNNNYIQCHENWTKVKCQTNNLLDSDATFRCLMGYIQGEKRLFSGERTGDLGGKRRDTIEKYNYSPKNYIHCIRLAYCGQIFFRKSYFPVNIMQENQDLANELLGVRLNPEKHSKTTLMDHINQEEKRLIHCYENRAAHFKFNREIANEICLAIYYPILQELYNVN